MKKNPLFLPANFFDLSSFPHLEILSGIETVWEVIPRLASYIASQFQKGEKIFVGEGTIIEEGAKICEPAIIGRNCFIGHGALLRENCLLGNNVRLGHGVEVKNSIFLNNSTAAHFNYIGDSIVGYDVNLGAGSKIANFRLDGKAVTIKIGGEIIETGLVKFGAIVGDHSKIGVNAVLNPGTILGKNCLVYPLTSVRGFHKEGAIIK